MIMIKTAKGKFYFSDFVYLSSGQSSEVDETTLTAVQLKDLVTSLQSNRLIISEIDLEKINTALSLLGTSTPGGGVDPSLLAGKEDKTNKLNNFTTGSNVNYPTTNAVVSYMTTATSKFLTGSSLAAYPTRVEVEGLLSGSKELKPVAGPYRASTVGNIPLSSLGTGGEYALCTPNTWIEIAGGLIIPAYNKSVIGTV